LKGSSKEKAGHPSQKPEKLIEHLILSSSRPGDLVLDPFLGSGTTAVVAERLERRWIGIEHNADYIRIAEKRLTEQREQNDTPLFRATSSELAS
jgi:site-specific DNA-methyltransferase (adenine-specific)